MAAMIVRPSTDQRTMLTAGGARCRRTCGAGGGAGGESTCACVQGSNAGGPAAAPAARPPRLARRRSVRPGGARHTRTVPSLPPDSSASPAATNCTKLISFRWPRRRVSSCAATVPAAPPSAVMSRRQMAAEKSCVPTAKSEPSGLKAQQMCDAAVTAAPASASAPPSSARSTTSGSESLLSASQTRALPSIDTDSRMCACSCAGWNASSVTTWV